MIYKPVQLSSKLLVLVSNVLYSWGSVHWEWLFYVLSCSQKKELNCTTTVWKLQMHNRSKHWLCFNTAQLLYLLSECGQEQLIIPTNDRHNKNYSADGRCGNHYISQLFPFCGVLVRKALQGCSDSWPVEEHNGRERGLRTHAQLKQLFHRQLWH